MTKTIKVETEKMVSMLDESKRLLTEKLARQTAKYQQLRKQVRAVGRIALSSVTREQATLVIQYLNAKEALEKTQKEIDADLAKTKEQDNKIKEQDDKIKELEAEIQRLNGGQPKNEAEDKEKDKEEKARPLEERIALAKKGDPKDLDLLVHDPHPWVRMAVLEQGREQDLKILQKDTTNYVRRAADKKLLMQEHDKETQPKKK